MITPKKSKSALLIATTWAVLGHFHHAGNTPMAATKSTPLSLCSAWTSYPGLRNHRHMWHPNHQNVPSNKRRRSSLFSTTTTTTAPNNVSAQATTYRDIFPASDTISNGTLKVDSIHTLYYEIHGRGPLTALFLHGGPGAGCFPNHARFFDPEKYTVVLLDQRGAGKSTPKGCIENNTLDHLVEDCERLRKHLRNNSMWDVVLGGSWGATLGLAYAQKHPNSLRSLVLRGICALRPSEIDWLFSASGGSSKQLPEAWQNFSQAMGTTEDCGRDTLHTYYDCFFHEYANNGTVDNTIRLAAAGSWMRWEMSATASAAAQSSHNQSNPSENTVLVSSPGGMWGFENHLGEPTTFQDQSPDLVAQKLRKEISDHNAEVRVNGPRAVRPLKESMPLFDSIKEAAKSNKTGGFRLPADYVPAQAMLTCYYSVNDLFVMGNRNLLLQPTTPVKIIGIQGGKDPICPPDTALELLQANSGNMELRVPLESGHSMYDPAIKHELVKATDRLADQFLAQQQ